MNTQGNVIGLAADVMTELRAQLPAVAGQTVVAIIDEVPGYADAVDGPLGASLEQGVQMALAGFLRVASRSTGSDPGTPLAPALDAAYSLGRGEASRGRSTDALLAAYRVGARVAWHQLAHIAVAADTPAATMAQFAELVFAYIDELSAASIFGHAEQLASTDRVHQRYRDRLTRSLLVGEPPDVLDTAADQADWRAPDTLTAVILPSARSRGLRLLTDGRVLQLADDLPGVDTDEDLLALLIPNAHGTARDRLKTSLTGRQAVVGPARAWQQIQRSYQRALRTRMAVPTSSDEVLDTEEHLAELIVTSDPDARADLRTQVLEPLSTLRPATAEKLTETLRAWLLHQGRRDEIAAAIFVHPQTVRYRMGQLRELYGDHLNDPDMVLAASIALAVPVGDSLSVGRASEIEAKR